MTASPAILESALCLRCNYPLRGLPGNVCPECGGGFDPSDVWTMNVGRAIPPRARWLVRHVGRPVRWATRTCWAAAFWGAAWLPGGYFITLLALGTLALLYSYRLVRAVVRWWILSHYRQPREIAGPPMRVSIVTAVVSLVLGFGNFFDLPLQITLQINRLLAHQHLHEIYAVRPMPVADAEDQMCGICFASRICVSPRGVTIFVGGAGAILYSEDVDASAPGGYRPHWEAPLRYWYQPT